ncbi:MAG: hypothetical protein KJ811_01895, partial [Candidatus Margulisbacteria bacterium]|nr:hypothetical protein [Candidatus Margulisiibacteriota bacterium]
TAVFVNIGWGLGVLGLLSYGLAKREGEKPWAVMGEHLFIAVLVIVLTNFVGQWIASWSGGTCP